MPSLFAFGEGEPTLVPRLLRLAGQHVELVWDVPNPDVVAPWFTNDGGWSWNLDRPEGLEVVGRAEPPSPPSSSAYIGRSKPPPLASMNIRLAATWCRMLGSWGFSADALATVDVGRRRWLLPCRWASQRVAQPRTARRLDRRPPRHRRPTSRTTFLTRFSSQANSSAAERSAALRLPTARWCCGFGHPLDRFVRAKPPRSRRYICAGPAKPRSSESRPAATTCRSKASSTTMA